MIYFVVFLVCLIMTILAQRINAKYFIRRRKRDLWQRCENIIQADRIEITGIIYGSDDENFKPLFKTLPTQHKTH